MKKDHSNRFYPFVSAIFIAAAWFCLHFFPQAAAWAGEPLPYSVSISEGHFQAITSLALSPEGDRIVTGSMDRTVKLWNTDTGAEMGTLAGNEQGVRVVDITRNAIVSGGNDGTVRLWRLKDHEPVAVFETQGDTVYSMAVSQDGRIAVTGHLRGTVRFWNLVDASLIQSIKAHQTTVHAVTISPDGKTMISCSRDETAIIWDMENRNPGETIKGRIRTADFSSEGRFLVAGYADDSIRVIDLSTGWNLKTYKGLSSVVIIAAFCSNEKEVMAVGASSEVCVWDRESGEVVRRFPPQNNPLLNARFYPEKKEILMAMGDADATLLALDSQTGKMIRKFQKNIRKISDAVFSTDGNFLICAGLEHGSLMKWNMTKASVVSDIQACAEGPVFLAVSPDGKHLACAGPDQRIQIWTISPFQCIRNFTIIDAAITKLAFSPDGNSIAAGSKEGTIIRLDSRTGKVLFRSPKDGGVITNLIFHPNNKTLFVSSADGFIRECSAENGKPLKTLVKLSLPIITMEISFDRDLLFYGDTAHLVRAIGIRSGTYKLYRGQQKAVTAFALNNDHTRLLTADGIGGLRLFDVAGEQMEKMVVQFQKHLVRKILFHPSRQQAVCIGADGRIAFWMPGSAEELARLAVFKTGEWAIVVPEGFFYTSEKGRDAVLLDYKNQSFPSDPFFDLLHRPDLIQQKLIQGSGLGLEPAIIKTRPLVIQRIHERN